MSVAAEHCSSAKALLPKLITALAGLPIGLLTVTFEYGLATVGCVASTAAELLAVYKLHAPPAAVDRCSDDDVADVIMLSRHRDSGPRHDR